MVWGGTWCPVGWADLNHGDKLASSALWSGSRRSLHLHVQGRTVALGLAPHLGPSGLGRPCWRSCCLQCRREAQTPQPQQGGDSQTGHDSVSPHCDVTSYKHDIM